MLKQVVDISSDEVVGIAQRMNFEGFRFVTATCIANESGPFELIYHFDRDFDFRNFRMYVTGSESVPSISRIYFCALLVENEIKELFGVNITDIIIDYGGRLLLSDGAPLTPMGGGQLTIEQLPSKGESV